MRRWLIMATLAALVTASVASAADITITHLTYTSHGDKYHAYLQEKAREFEAKHPGVKIDVLIGTHDKFQTMLVGGVPPDVVDLPDFAHLGPMGQLVDMRPLMQKDGLLKAYSPAVIQSVSAPSGAIYTMPLELSLYVAYFNRDQFNERGLMTPDRLGSAWNWDAVIQNGKKLTVDRDSDGNPEFYGVDRPWGAGWRIAVGSAGGFFYEFDKNMQPVRSLWNTSEVQTAIESYARIYREGITPHLRPGVDQTKFYFWKGGTAIDIQDGVGIIGAFLKDATFDWDLSLMPIGKKGPVSMGGGAGPHIVSATKHLNETWEWVKFYSTVKENVEAFSRITGRLPALSSAMSSFVNTLDIRDKNNQMILQQAGYLIEPQFTYPLIDKLNPRKINLDPVWRGDVAPATWLETTHRQMTAIIDELKTNK